MRAAQVYINTYIYIHNTLYAGRGKYTLFVYAGRRIYIGNTLFAGRRNLNVGMPHAYMLASLHAYVLTCLHAYMLTCLPTYMFERWQDSCLHAGNIRLQLIAIKHSSLNLC